MEPLWFRIGQFRLRSYPVHFLVQRAVLINSFVFTLLIARVDSEWPSQEFDQWIDVFSSSNPEARPVLRSGESLTTTAAGDHFLASMCWSMSNYPTRFVEEQTPLVTHALKAPVDRVPVVALHVPHDLIEVGDTTPIAAAMRMVATREKAMVFRERVGVMVDGFNDNTERNLAVSQGPAVFPPPLNRVSFRDAGGPS